MYPNWNAKQKWHKGLPVICYAGWRSVDLLLYSFLTSALDGSGWSTTRSSHLPLEKSPGTQEGGYAPGPFCTGAEKRKSLSPAGVKPRIVQRVASRYTDYVIPAQFYTKYIFNLMFAIYSYTPVQARFTRSYSYDNGLFL